MSGEGELNLDTAERRRTLWIVLWLNVAIAPGFFITGAAGDSNEVSCLVSCARLALSIRSVGIAIARAVPAHMHLTDTVEATKHCQPCD